MKGATIAIAALVAGFALLSVSRAGGAARRGSTVAAGRSRFQPRLATAVDVAERDFSRAAREREEAAARWWNEAAPIASRRPETAAPALSGADFDEGSRGWRANNVRVGESFKYTRWPRGSPRPPPPAPARPPAGSPPPGA